MMYICTAGSDVLRALYSELTTQLDACIVHNTDVVSSVRDGVS